MNKLNGFFGVVFAALLTLVGCGTVEGGATNCASDNDCLRSQTCDTAKSICVPTNGNPQPNADMMGGGNPQPKPDGGGVVNNPPTPCTSDNQCLANNSCQAGFCQPNVSGGATKKYVVYFPGAPAGSTVDRRECFATPALKGSNKVGDVKPWPRNDPSPAIACTNDNQCPALSYCPTVANATCKAVPDIAWKSLGNPVTSSNAAYTSAYVEIYASDDLRVQCVDVVGNADRGYGFNAVVNGDGSLSPAPGDTAWVWRVGTAAGTKVSTIRVRNLNGGINGQTAD